jgi:tRNA-dihydrouridine synthase A
MHDGHRNRSQNLKAATMEGTMGVSDGADDARGKELHIAPMLDVSYQEFRYFMRLLTKRTVLWTEMVVDETLIYSKISEHYLYFDKTCEHPIICQMGGNQPNLASMAVRIVEDHGYDELNLNMGCPSDRVAAKGGFGAALMVDADRAVEMLDAMNKSARNLPISVKIRIGVDNQDDWDFLEEFVGRLSNVCRRFYVHARKVLTKGLKNTAQNRRIPPLNYPRVYRLCGRFPDCEFYINGGILSLDAAKTLCYGTRTSQDDDRAVAPPGHEVPCDLCRAPFGSCIVPPICAPPNLRGCMLGRAAISNPAIFGDADRFFYGEESNPCKSRRDVLLKYCAYLEELYPRRCCDDDERITSKLPSPTINAYDRKACPMCCPVCSKDGTTKPEDVCLVCGSTDGDDDDTSRHVNTKKNVKVTTRVVNRCTKPILSLFLGMAGGAMKWKRTINKLSQDLQIRNCGPAHILRVAVDTVLDELLDQPFVPEQV